MLDSVQSVSLSPWFAKTA